MPWNWCIAISRADPCHPPIGLLLFVVSSVGRVPIKAVMIESLPFLAWSLAVLVLAIMFPPITTWLPSQIQ